MDLIEIKNYVSFKDNVKWLKTSAEDQKKIICKLHF